ncbi:hypothetical protein DFQ05_2369 [Winogradskyella wandonensis]|uniref:Lipid-binding hydrolase n=1 Tax=Winogradskyella wandonensis TaxID=1442586 RepID=A0A4R1KK61_9FLAO|nr:DUF6252 family protein [Winogradskyella wandonensis]TCK65155.1 hypothetical protein DFQ05_2369 [Winogradskyella wandonensis]
MNKNILLLLLVLILGGCADEVEFNNPAMQANFEGDSWRATSFAGDIDFGGFIFEGRRGTEVLQIITENDTRGTFELTPESVSKAIFRDAEGIIYSTKNLPDPEITIYPPEGVIVVDDIDNAEPKRVTGTFRFTAFSEDGLRSVNFINGVFFKVSLLGGLQELPD